MLALFKGASAIGALLLLRWRVRHPISRRLRLAYVVSTAAMCGATGLLFARTALPLVPFLFDGGVILLVLMAFRDARTLRALVVGSSKRERRHTPSPTASATAVVVSAE